MKNRLIVRGLLVTGMTVALWAASAGRASAQVSCNPEDPNCVCVAAAESLVCATPGEPVMCGFPTALGTPCAAPFKGTSDTWNLQFGPNNSIKLATDVMCNSGFVLFVDAFRITQGQYAVRRDNTKFADTVCNPTADGMTTDCVFYRLHGEFVDPSCYPKASDAWQYSIFWNIPPIQGNKHDWMLLRAKCQEFPGDPNFCDPTDKFSDDVTVMVEKKPPVGFDPVVRGSGDGISDFIVAISTKHPHKGFPSAPFPPMP